uniref:Protein pelota homolog n=1 Tax=Gasterosteus aculeatus aculeatus TaxID=481459 RepID=A0AAQ4QP46_GASAC
MKLLHKDIEKDNAGQVTLMPEEAEDMWHTYNLLQVGDSLRASTIRKVQTESATGSVGSSRVRTTLTLSVETIDFDSQACQLRVKGTNLEENQYVKMGAYHTIEVAHVEKAVDALAIDTLLISDKLFRHQDVPTRSRYVRLVDSVRDNGGTVRMFSSLHVSGEQLTQLSGVAAILRFPIADLSEPEDDSSSDED